MVGHPPTSGWRRPSCQWWWGDIAVDGVKIYAQAGAIVHLEKSRGCLTAEVRVAHAHQPVIDLLSVCLAHLRRSVARKEFAR